MKVKCSPENCRIENSYRVILKEIYLKLDSESIIDIYDSESKGKHVHSNSDIGENTNFLQEVPFVSWPIKTFLNSQEDIVFCENCLKIRNLQNLNEFLSLSELGFDKRICSPFCFKKVSGLDFEALNQNYDLLRNGWGFYLQGRKGLTILRNYQKSVDKFEEIPITAEAISRCISQLAADIHFYWLELGKKQDNLHIAFNLGCKTINNFVAPPSTLFPEINFNSLTNCIRSVMMEPIKSSFSNDEVVNILLSKNTIEQLLGQLTLNSQGINVWGSADFKMKDSSLERVSDKSESEICMIKGACLCVIQSCFNHSCDPNCYVHSIDDSTVHIIANRDIMKGEELTISYINNNLPLDQRKKLIQNYHFNCQCIVCKKEERNILRGDCEKITKLKLDLELS